MLFTSVTGIKKKSKHIKKKHKGHIISTKFDDKFKNWNQIKP